ncbi:MAG: anti-sigma factor [Thermoflavifilum aggregans]|nr:anti-sigma factor [Thermoflavifilum aggregans]
MDIQEYISSGIIELYVLGMLSEQEAAEVKAYARQYREVQQAIEMYEQTLEQYASLHAVQPPAALKEKIWQKLQSPSSRASAGSTRRVLHHPMMPYLMAACVILLIGSVILNVMFYSQYQHVREETEKLQAQQAHLQQQVSQYALALQVLQTPDYTPVLLKGVAQHPDFMATVYWNKNNGEVYLLPNLMPPAPAGKQYQLWAIVDGKPVSAGVYPTSPLDIPVQKMAVIKQPVQAFAITLEKEGGSPTPTLTAMYVMGKVNG